MVGLAQSLRYSRSMNRARANQRAAVFARPQDFRRLWAGSTVGHFGSQLSSVALPVLAVATLGANAWQMGLLAAISTSAFLFLGLPAGAWVDRWSKRRVLVAADLLRGFALAGIVALALTGHATMPALYGAALLISVGTVFFDVAHQSFVPALTGIPHVVAGNARLQTTESMAQVGAPALAGQLLRVASAPLLIAANAALYLISALVLRRIEVAEGAPAARRSLRAEIGEGLRFVIGHRLLMRMVATTALGNLAWGVVGALEALYILRDLGLSEATMGAIFSIAALGGLGGAAASSAVTRLVGTRRSIPLFALLMAAPAAAIPLAARSTAPALVMTA